MDPLYGWLEGPVRPQFGWRFSRESCNAATPMPKALWFLTLAILMLGLHAVDAKGFEHSSVNATASPVGSGIDNVTTPLGVACLPSGSCGSRRLLQEVALPCLICIHCYIACIVVWSHSSLSLLSTNTLLRNGVEFQGCTLHSAHFVMFDVDESSCLTSVLRDILPPR